MAQLKLSGVVVGYRLQCMYCGLEWGMFTSRNECVDVALKHESETQYTGKMHEDFNLLQCTRVKLS